MSRIHLLSKHVQNKNLFLSLNAIQKTRWRNLSSSSSSDDESNRKKIEEKKKNQEALNKLNNLLITMREDNISATKAKLDLARPINKRRKNLDEKQEPKIQKSETDESRIVSATREVAEAIGGDVKQTQSELLTKLLNATKSDEKLNTDLRDLVKGMRIDDEKKPQEGSSRAEHVRLMLQTQTGSGKIDTGKMRSRPTRPERSSFVTENIELFGSEPLGIFTNDDVSLSEGVENKTWNRLYEKDLKLAVTHPPANYFQQMILWTEQEKVWKFPIDNEQGFEEEKKVYFTEHVFLEKYLEPWCPSKGPLRHFMELVCVGLSKNPYLTVEAKKEHLKWFENYFKDKKQLLEETGLIQDQSIKRKTTQKQIEQ